MNKTNKFVGVTKMRQSAICLRKFYRGSNETPSISSFVADRRKKRSFVVDFRENKFMEAIRKRNVTFDSLEKLKLSISNAVEAVQFAACCHFLVSFFL